jgi:S-adenosylmethionine-dependent methyltransferase
MENGGSQSDCPDRLTAFGQHAQEWDRYTTTPLGRLRQELTMAHLMAHLGSASPAHVLDAGAGTGGYALALLQGGHHVCLLDFAPEMLDIASERIRAIDPALLDRAEFYCLPIEQAAERFPDAPFQAVLAHTLLEYLDDPWDALASLIRVLQPGGLLSLLIVNPHADAFRLSYDKRDLIGARQALTGDTSRSDLFGLPRHVLPQSQLREALQEEGVEIMAEYGIRIFSDHFKADELTDPAFYRRLSELEMAASPLEPYRSVARYLHLLGRKRL